MGRLVEARSPKAPPSVYFSEAYGAAESAQTGHQWVSLSDQVGTWQIPLLLRDFEGKATDATTPYGYGGIYVASTLSRDDIEERWHATRDLLADLDVVSVFLRSSPFLETPALSDLALPTVQVREPTSTFGIQIHDEEANWAALKGRARTATRKAWGEGLTARVTQLDDQIQSPSHSFRTLYENTMRRLNAADQYYFSNEYFQRLAQLPKDSTALAEVKNNEGVTVASAILFRDPTGTVHYHLSASNPEHARIGANNLLLWEIIRWAGENDYLQVHLGGGLKPRDNLEKFKESFGGTRLNFETAEIVINGERYAELTELNPHPDARGYFPAYRAPRTSPLHR